MIGLIFRIKQCAFPLAFVVLMMSTLQFPAGAQTLGTGESITPPIGRLVLGLVICFALIFATVWMLRAIRNRSNGVAFKSLFDPTKLDASTQIKIKESKRLNPTSDVCLLEYDNTEFLIVASAHQTVVLRERDLTTDTDTSSAS